jgi:hypothetical protein
LPGATSNKAAASLEEDSDGKAMIMMMMMMMQGDDANVCLCCGMDLYPIAGAANFEGFLGVVEQAVVV